MKDFNLRTRAKTRYHQARNSLSTTILLTPAKSWRMSITTNDSSFHSLGDHPPSPSPEFPSPISSPTSSPRDSKFLGKLLRRHTAPIPSTPVFEEQKYHHVPVNAASGFVSSTTTGKMLSLGTSIRVVGKDEEEMSSGRIRARDRDRMMSWVEVVKERDDRIGEGIKERNDAGRRGSAGNWWDERKLVDVVDDWRSSQHY